VVFESASHLYLGPTAGDGEGGDTIVIPNSSPLSEYRVTLLFAVRGEGPSGATGLRIADDTRLKDDLYDDAEVTAMG
jgi:hypothetical protein